MQTFRLQEIEAAERLINLAIKLHFSQKDPVGVHAVTVTGYKILRRLCLDHKLPDIVPDYLNYLGPDDRHFFWPSLATLDQLSSQTVFSPTERTYNIADDITDLFLFIACALFRMLGKGHSHEMRIYIIWYKAINRLRPQQDPIYNENTKEGFDYLKSLSREKQLTLGYDALKNLRKPKAAAQRPLSPRFG